MESTLSHDSVSRRRGSWSGSNRALRAARVRVVEHGVVAARAVVVGARQGDTLGIVSGLKPGERVIVQGPAGLRDGTRVRAPDAAP